MDINVGRISLQAEAYAIKAFAEATKLSIRAPGVAKYFVCPCDHAKTMIPPRYQVNTIRGVPPAAAG